MPDFLWRRQRRLASNRATEPDLLKLVTLRNKTATPSTEPIMTAVYNNQFTVATAVRWIQAEHGPESLALAARAGMTEPELRAHLNNTSPLDWSTVEFLASLRATP